MTPPEGKEGVAAILMVSVAATPTPEGADVPDPDLKKVTITMPAWMLEDLRQRARRRSISVTEHIRRAVSLERMLFEDPDNEVILRHAKTGQETSIRLP